VSRVGGLAFALVTHRADLPSGTYALSLSTPFDGLSSARVVLP
jgi:hypothetical protein